MKMFVSLDRFQEPDDQDEYEYCADCDDELELDDCYEVDDDLICECCLKSRFRVSA